MKKPMSAFFLLLAGCAAAHAETAPLRDDFMMAPIVFRRSQIPPAELGNVNVKEDGQAVYLFGAIGKDMNDYWNILTRQK